MHAELRYVLGLRTGGRRRQYRLGIAHFAGIRGRGDVNRYTDLRCSFRDGARVVEILTRGEGHNRGYLLWMFGRDLEDKRRRIAAAPEDDREVLCRGPIEGCLEVRLRLFV